MESCPVCGAVVYSADGVCEVCDPSRGPAEALNASVKPRRHWSWYAGKIAEGAIPLLIEGVLEIGAGLLTMCLSGDFRNEDSVGEANAARPVRRSSSSSGSSAIAAGRMRQTDKVKGPDCPLPNKPGIYHHINKETGAREYVGQTDNLRVRQQQHARSGKLDTDTQFIRFGLARDDATKDDLCQTEIDHIARHDPSGNTTRGGNGRR